LITNIPPFSGFSKILQFLGELEKDKNNNTHGLQKRQVDDNIVLPAKSFVTTIGILQSSESRNKNGTKFNKTIMRLKDMRFAKAAYRNYFLIHFGRFKMDSEFFVYLIKMVLNMDILNNTQDMNYI